MITILSLYQVCYTQHEHPNTHAITELDIDSMHCSVDFPGAGIPDMMNTIIIYRYVSHKTNTLLSFEIGL